MINKAEERLIENWMWDNFKTINYIFPSKSLYRQSYHNNNYFILDSNRMIFKKNGKYFNYPDVKIVFGENDWELIIQNNQHSCEFKEEKDKFSLEFVLPKDFNNLFNILLGIYSKSLSFPQGLPIVHLKDLYDNYLINLVCPSSFSYSYIPSSGTAKIWIREYFFDDDSYKDDSIRLISYEEPKDILDQCILQNEMIERPAWFRCIKKKSGFKKHYEFYMKNERHLCIKF